MMQSSSTQSPLLTTMVTNHSSTLRQLNIATLSHYLIGLGSRSVMRDSLLHVRELASEYMMLRQTACWPALILALIFNVMFFVTSILVMITSASEAPRVYLRVWIIGYGVKCGVHGVSVGLECKKKWDCGSVSNGESLEVTRDENSGSERDGEDVVLNLDPEDVVQDHRDEDLQTSVAKRLASADILLSFTWWIIGFYWIFISGETLTHDSPQLYWMCITFLVFDAFILVICVAVACVVGLALCFCVPCMLVIIYFVTDQEEGIEDCIQSLPKYKFQRTGVVCEKLNGDSQIEESPCGKMIECNTNTPTEHVLPLEDALCCICFCAYEDGKVLRRLPCHHHFHSACIVRWLYINPTCPLCKTHIFNYGKYSDRDEGSSVRM